MLDIIATLTGRAILRPNALPTAEYSIKIDRPISKSELVLALETLLGSISVGVAPLGDGFLKVVALGTVKNEAPEMIEGSALTLPASGGSPRRFSCSSFYGYQEFIGLIHASVLTPGMQGGVTVLVQANAALVTDTVSNLQRVETCSRRSTIPPPPASRPNSTPSATARRPATSSTSSAPSSSRSKISSAPHHLQRRRSHQPDHPHRRSPPVSVFRRPDRQARHQGRSQHPQRGHLPQARHRQGCFATLLSRSSPARPHAQRIRRLRPARPAGQAGVATPARARPPTCRGAATSSVRPWPRWAAIERGHHRVQQLVAILARRSQQLTVVVSGTSTTSGSSGTRRQDRHRPRRRSASR